METTMDVERNHQRIGYLLASFVAHFDDPDERVGITLAVLNEIGRLQLRYGLESGMEVETISRLTREALDEICDHTAEALDVLKARRDAEGGTIQ